MVLLDVTTVVPVILLDLILNYPASCLLDYLPGQQQLLVIEHGVLLFASN